MPIIFRSPLSSQIANETFLDKTIDDVKKGKLGLYKVNIADPESIEDVQDFTNDIASVAGIAGENDPDKNTYSSHEIISDGDNRKVAIGKLDAQVAVNIQSIDDLEELILEGIIRIKGYISDNAFVTANGAPVGGSVYYNSTTGKVRVYNGLDEQWEDVGSSILGIQEVPTGLINGINTTFDIANAPLNDGALNVFLNGLIVPNSEYSFSTPTITFNNAPPAGQDIYVTYLSEGNPASPVVSSGTNNVIYRQITAQEIIDGFLTLPNTPVAPSQSLVDTIGGTSQAFGLDFTIVGDELIWENFNLENEIAEDDILRIQYFT